MGCSVIKALTFRCRLVVRRLLALSVPELTGGVELNLGSVYER